MEKLTNFKGKWVKLKGSKSVIAMVIRKNQKIRKSSLLHSLYLSQCLEKMSLCNLKIFLCISIEKWKPRIIPRSRPSASTSKRTLASIFQSWYTRKFSNYTWTIFPNTSSRQCVKERTISNPIKKYIFDQSLVYYILNKIENRQKHNCRLNH